MKFTCEGLVLSDAAVTVSKACSAKTTTPVLECIKLTAKNDVITLIAYDGEISIEKKMTAEVFEEGEVCVNGRLFTDFIGKVSGMNLVISTDENGMEISYEGSSSKMQILPASDFPALKRDMGDEYFEVGENELKTLIAKTVFCCATDDSRPILKGCLLEGVNGKLTATALDGYRMAVSECAMTDGGKSVKLVCPARTLGEIARMLGGDSTLRVYVTRNMLSVSVNDTVLTSRLYVGEFVNRANILPTSFATEVYVNRPELVESIERALVLIRGDKNNMLVFNIGYDGIRINANSEIGNVSENVNAETDGKEIKIALNGKFMLEALKALDGDNVKLSFNTPISPFTVVDKDNENSTYLILPVRTAS